MEGKGAAIGLQTVTVSQRRRVGREEGRGGEGSAVCADTICNDTQISILNGCLIVQLVVLCDCDTHTHKHTHLQRGTTCVPVWVCALCHTHTERERGGVQR